VASHTGTTTLAQLADLTGATLRGDGETAIAGVAGMRNAREGEIALLGGARYIKHLAATRASALVVGQDFDTAATELPLLIAETPDAAFEAIAARFGPAPAPAEPGIHPRAFVAPDATVDPTASVGAGCVVEAGAVIGPRTALLPLAFVGRDARVGADCVLHPQVAVLERCVLGDRVVLHSGTVVGADGFGYDTVDGVHQKVPQRGIVEIGDDVETGANVTIDRARFGRTVIGRGTKIDNLAQIAHNVSTGEHCLIVAQVGVAGSVSLGHHVVLAAQAGLVGHIHIGDGAIVGAKAGVPGDLEPGSIVLGAPAQDIRNERRCMVLYQRLPDMARQAKQLAKTIESLEERVRHLEGASEDD